MLHYLCGKDYRYNAKVADIQEFCEITYKQTITANHRPL